LSESLNLSDHPISVGAAQEYVESVYGGPVTEQALAFSLAIGSITKLVDNNPDRLALSFINLGANEAYVSFDNTPSATDGIRLASNGGFLSMDVINDHMLQTREWYAIAPTDVTNLYVIQVFRFALT